MKKTAEQKAKMKQPTPKGDHRHGKGNPLAGKNRRQRAELSAAWGSMNTWRAPARRT